MNEYPPYGNPDHTTNDWWKPPPREYTAEELKILRRKMRESLKELMKEPLERAE